MTAYSFAIYRLPHKNECTFIHGTTECIRQYSDLKDKSSFVIAPFTISASTPLCIVHADEIRKFSGVEYVSGEVKNMIDCCCAKNVSAANTTESGREEYSRDFSIFHSHLESGEFSKIVLARHTTAETSRIPFEMYEEACKRYPRMFITLFSTPESGTWLMATPEVLLESQGKRWHTMALAGTMKLHDDTLLFDEPAGNRQQIMWGEKNIQEQRYVATYINEQLRPLANDMAEDGPRTIRAGNLVHLRSDFLFTSNTNDIGQLIEVLHPTPAVCGLPKDKTRKFIIANEHTPRDYYSGFVGPVCIGGETHLYVSLRCMRISNGTCHLFAGGGLLRDSMEKLEWEETEDKMMTMKALL